MSKDPLKRIKNTAIEVNEFIVQEMFRECNTMGSKSNSSLLNNYVVEMKAEVTRLKEQVLNVE